MADDDRAGTDEVVAELIDIKRLLILALTEGVEGKLSQAAIAGALGIGQASVSRILSPPKRRPNKRQR